MAGSYKTVFGVTLVAMSGVVGFISAWLLDGLGICGFNLTAGMVCFALASGAVLPAMTVRVLPAPWWVPALVFSSLIPIGIIFQMLGDEWNRAVAGSGCVAVAFMSAWLFRPRSGKVEI
jgi:hypothetical protein